MLKRSFFALAAGFLALLLGAPASAQETKVLKMQATWPASLTLYENFTFFAERVKKLSGGKLKIEAMPAGAVVPPFEVLDATHKKVIDGAHTWAGYWQGSTRRRFSSRAGRAAPSAWTTSTTWAGCTKAAGSSSTRVLQGHSQANVVVIPILPSSPQAFGWFKKPIKNLADFKGMKCRQTGMAAEIYTEMGMTVVNMPGGEIIPSAQRGVIDCAEWVGGIEDLRLGFHTVWKYHYTPSLHENTSVGELLINGDVWKCLARRPGDHEIRRSEAFSSGGRAGSTRTPTRSKRCRRSTACRCCVRPPTS